MLGEREAETLGLGGRPRASEAKPPRLKTLLLRTKAQRPQILGAASETDAESKRPAQIATWPGPCTLVKKCLKCVLFSRLSVYYSLVFSVFNVKPRVDLGSFSSRVLIFLASYVSSERKVTMATGNSP